MTVLVGILFGCLVLCAAWTARLSGRIYGHVRRHHPEVWRRFGFPGSAALPEPKEEAGHARAQAAFLKFLHSRARRELEDAVLERLYRARVIFFALDTGLFAAVCFLAIRFRILG